MSVLGEHLGGQLRQVDISSRHGAGDTQLALFAVGDLLAVLVQEVRLEARKRSADGRVVIRLVQLKGHGDTQQLAQSVGVLDVSVGAVNAADTLAAAVDELQAALPDGQLLEHLRTDDRGGDMVLVDVFVNKQDILALCFSEDMDLSASPQGRQNIVSGDRKIEGRHAHLDIVKAGGDLKLSDYRVGK